jgi:hypothetical protein
VAKDNSNLKKKSTKNTRINEPKECAYTIDITTPNINSPIPPKNRLVRSVFLKYFLTITDTNTAENASISVYNPSGAVDEKSHISPANIPKNSDAYSPRKHAKVVIQGISKNKEFPAGVF